MRVKVGKAVDVDIDIEAVIPVPASYMVEGDEVKTALNGVLKPSATGYEFTGILGVSAVFACDKCMSPAVFSTTHEVFEIFSKAPAANEGEDHWPLDGDFVDFNSVIVANVCALLPMKILCKENCQGLCESCGKDRNLGNCDCEKPLDPRFGLLSDFFKEV